MNSAFCALPFYRATIRSNGGIGPCCYIRNYANVKTSSIEEFWQSERLAALRENMLSGQKCTDCESCYADERNSGRSMRIESLRDHSITDQTDLRALIQGPNYLGREFPNHLEFHLGNLCNLKCLTCNPRDSSSFLIENNILKISNHRQEDYQMADETIEAVISTALEHRIKVLDLRGGESMLMPAVKRILNELPDDHGIECLRLQTNCTVLDDYWKRTFQRFEQVEIMMSIDAYGPANEYIRYPSKWEEIEQNVDYFLSLSNIKLYVNCTISNLNFLVLRPLIEWCRQKNIYFHYSLCTDPAYFQYNNLPAELFNQCLANLADCPEVAKLALESNNNKWNEFCQMIDLRDKHRRNSIFDILPELKPYWSEQK